jgi:Zn-dependent peptidase ImmA (M78 family)/transcriptional regulator with XRE-family HTH domain
MMQEIQPGMITIAREARGMTQQELAMQLHMHKTQVSRMESGELPVGEETLEALAIACSFPATFFAHDPGTRQVQVRFRRRQKVPSRLLSALEAQCFIISRNADYLARALQVDPQPLPVLLPGKTASPAEMAISLRQLWQLEEGPLRSLAGLLETHGILVSRFDFGTERVDSRSMLTAAGHPLIFVNSQLTGDRQRFSLAYELGQLLMNREGRPADEKEVNRFAAELLMPAGDILSFFSEGVNLSRLAEGKKHWKVSMISLLYRADDLGLLSTNQKRYLLQQFNQLRIRRTEPPELDVDPEACTLLRGMLYQYLQQYDLGLLECCRHLCITPTDLLHYYG